jgi:hypothetical protein
MNRAARKFGLLGSLTVFLAATSAAQATVEISASFGSSITSNANAAAIEGAINSAIGAISSLYSNIPKITVDFTDVSAGTTSNLLGTSQYEYITSYSSYTQALTAAASADPANKVLAKAVANLKFGNDANGASNIVFTGAQALMLGFTLQGGYVAPTININSLITNFSFTSSVSSSQFDLLGGGGGGSWLNYIQQNCAGGGPYCNLYGPLDLYRYSAADTPSFTTSGAASSYLSFDGGVTELVAFNQNSGGDYADFAPNGVGAGQLIQDAFNSTGKDEAYTASSPEFAMLESLGYDASAVPEPSTWIMMILGFGGLGLGKFGKARTNAARVATA